MTLIANRYLTVEGMITWHINPIRVFQPSAEVVHRRLCWPERNNFPSPSRGIHHPLCTRIHTYIYACISSFFFIFLIQLLCYILLVIFINRKKYIHTDECRIINFLMLDCELGRGHVPCMHQIAGSLCWLYVCMCGVSPTPVESRTGNFLYFICILYNILIHAQLGFP